MPRFKFNLQPVLEQRERFERDKQHAVALLEAERLALESRIRQCQHMIEDERHSMGNALSRGQRIDLKSVRYQAGASLRHQFDAQRAVLELAGVMKKLGIAREELIEAASQRKAVEMLRDQQLQAFKDKLDQQESYELDEMSVMRFVRPKNPKRVLRSGTGVDGNTPMNNNAFRRGEG